MIYWLVLKNMYYYNFNRVLFCARVWENGLQTAHALLQLGETNMKREKLQNYTQRFACSAENRK